MNLSTWYVRAGTFFVVALATLPLARVSAQEMDHPGMEMPSPAETPPDRESAPAEEKEADPHAGHAMPAPAREDQAEPMDHSMMGHGTPGQTGEPREPIPAITPADRVAAFPDVGGHAVHDKSIQNFILVNRLEA